MFEDIKALVDLEWENDPVLEFHAVYDGWPEEICSNYYSEITESGLLVSSGGDRLVGPPIIAGDSYFPDWREIE